ncbi:MAG: FAD:protein FMN transferase [Pseudomonadota bacterium]
MIRVAGAALVLVLAACSAPTSTHERSLHTFGTSVRIELRGLNTADASVVADQIERSLNRWNHDWYAWGDGALGSLNQTLANTTVATTSADIGALLSAAKLMRARSGGLFDPTVGELVELWQFDDLSATTDDLPESTELDSARANAAFTVDLENGQAIIRTERAGVQFDLGGIAKGYALAELERELRAASVPAAIVDIGGDVLVIDANANSAMTIGIVNPRGTGTLAHVVANDGEAVVTSGDYARYREIDGERYHHIIDPRTGRPGTGARAVTVIDRDPVLADAAATALMIAGSALFHETSRRMGVEFALMIDADGNALTTPAMRERLHGLRETAGVTP